MFTPDSRLKFKIPVTIRQIDDSNLNKIVSLGERTDAIDVYVNIRSLCLQITWRIIMKKFASAALAASLVLATGPVAFADIIEGNWKTKSGETAAISKCGGSYCIKLKTGTHAGKTIGRLKGSDGTYNGTITDPEDDAEYSGSAKVKGSSMKLKGCAFKVLCRTQNWKKL